MQCAQLGNVFCVDCRKRRAELRTFVYLYTCIGICEFAFVSIVEGALHSLRACRTDAEIPEGSGKKKIERFCQRCLLPIMWDFATFCDLLHCSFDFIWYFWHIIRVSLSYWNNAHTESAVCVFIVMLRMLKPNRLHPPSDATALLCAQLEHIVWVCNV